MEKSTINQNLINTLSSKDRQLCEVWTRVMGYHRPVSSFNRGKKNEHAERLHFQESACKSC